MSERKDYPTPVNSPVPTRPNGVIIPDDEPGVCIFCGDDMPRDGKQFISGKPCKKCSVVGSVHIKGMVSDAPDTIQPF